MRYTRHGLYGRCGVYMITNTVNGKRYIGSSVNVGARINQHFNTACRIYKERLDFYNDISVYGRDTFSFELLEECSKENKIERERFWYEKLKPEYNLIPPSDTPLLDPIVRERCIAGTLKPENQKRLNKIKQTPEYKKRLHDAQSYKMRPCYGVSNTEVTRTFDCIADAAQWVVDRTGKHKPTVVNKIKQCVDGSRNTAYGYRWCEGGDSNE